MYKYYISGYVFVTEDYPENKGAVVARRLIENFFGVDSYEAACSLLEEAGFTNYLFTLKEGE